LDRTKGAVVSSVDIGSYAFKAGVKPGDVLLRVNGKKIKDIIGYRYRCLDDLVSFELEHEDGEKFSFEVENCSSRDVGINFDDVVFDGVRRCKNKCIFCFEDQLPQSARASLRIKDDDYRLSFLQGNFVTLTNLDSVDLVRIKKMKLSPLYISVHATDDNVRSFVLGRTYKEPIMDTLRSFKKHRITVHAQIVLTPGVNDGAILEKSLNDLKSLYPSVQSVGIVPVGLTKHRENLYQIDQVSKEKALEVIKIVDKYAALSLKDNGQHVFFASDEFYIKAELPFPDKDYYEDYPQYENGIGISRCFLDDFDALEKELPIKIDVKKRVFCVTGVSSYKVMADAEKRLNRIDGLEFNLIPVTNEFFGNTITVAGLVVGQDIVNALKDKDLSDSVVLIPDIMLRQSEDVFLDDTDLDFVKKSLNADVRVVPNTAKCMIEGSLY